MRNQQMVLWQQFFAPSECFQQTISWENRIKLRAKLHLLRPIATTIQSTDDFPSFSALVWHKPCCVQIFYGKYICFVIVRFLKEYEKKYIQSESMNAFTSFGQRYKFRETRFIGSLLFCTLSRALVALNIIKLNKYPSLEINRLLEQETTLSE